MATSAAVKFYLNGELREIPDRTDLTQMIRLFSLPDKRVAIELNGEVIRRAQWAFTFVVQDDKVEVVHFVGGG
ncbi:MAG: sulfur carrier protein ThiS [Acidobacteria bacterium]|nr:sulfur carrier protein ThiS [Acidobacteriota bacterium]